MDTIGQPYQIFSLRDLLSSTLIATVDADTATSQRFFNNMCEIAFEEYNPHTNQANNLRTLAFNYSTSDGNLHTLKVPILSLVPLPLLQVQDANFSFDVQIMGIQDKKEDVLSLTDDSDNSSMDNSDQLIVALQPMSASVNENMVSSGIIMPNMKVNIKLNQADMPGGLSRMLSVVNNID